MRTKSVCRARLGAPWDNERADGEIPLRLSTLLTAIEHRRSGPGDPEIDAITHDSRKVQPGSLFAAFRGLKADGADFIPAAVAAGAAAVLAEVEMPRELSVPLVSVANARRAAGILAARL